MAQAGRQIKWNVPIVVDKHCIGGIPGNRTSMIVVPIVAAHGLTIPKTSSRAITSPAGTADTMEVLTRVDLSVEQMKEVVAACKGCLVWGGHVNLSPADDILISVERPLSIDTREQMVASIMSKKIAVGSTHLLIDLPVGPTAKLANALEAKLLAMVFLQHLTVLAVPSDVRLPLEPRRSKSDWRCAWVCTPGKSKSEVGTLAESPCTRRLQLWDNRMQMKYLFRGL
jgi:thymidine phosphorylase